MTVGQEVALLVLGGAFASLSGMLLTWLNQRHDRSLRFKMMLAELRDASLSIGDRPYLNIPDGSLARIQRAI